MPRALLQSPRWVRWERVLRNGKATKRPIMPSGRSASSTDSRTWSNHSEAAASVLGDGLGFVLGDGLGCIDLDHCLDGDVLTPAAALFVARYPDSYIEVSPSGDGLHIWGTADEVAGTKRVVDGLSIETYSTGRYITVTGRVFQRGVLAPL